MSTLTAPTQALVDKFDQLGRVLNEEIVESTAEVNGMQVALAAGQSMFLLGPPGVAKSMLVDRAQKYVGGEKFSILFTRFTQPEEVFGPFSWAAMKEGRFERVLEGYLATAHMAFGDEIFKANSAILNALLWAINERKYRHGNKIIDIPLSTFVGASNELPEDAGLAALFDRLLLRFYKEPVRDAANFKLVLGQDLDPNPTPIMTWEEVRMAKAEVARVVIPTTVIDALTDLRAKLKAEKIEPTPRRYRQSLRAVAAVAWLDGCMEADPEHIAICEHIFWDVPEQRDAVAKLVLSGAEPLLQECKRLKAAAVKFDQEVTEGVKDADRMRRGTEIYRKVVAANKELSELRVTAGKSRRRLQAIDDVHRRMTRVIERVLIELFDLTPAQVEEQMAKVRAGGK